MLSHLTKWHNANKKEIAKRSAEDINVHVMLLFGIMGISDTHNCAEVEAVTM